ncbi:MAG: lantibiotic dehydratase family protein, partial [Candidatus Azobacteroides sp.]|nr:lantibiotic dehydratase family protein [Candidatus Azobacteroides sp.]
MYHPFHSFFVRTPHFSFNSLKEELFETKILRQQVQEAIYIASPVLYTELQKHLAGTITVDDEKQRIESSIYRYINRMSSRCTPFGLFAGCSTGCITGDTTSFVLDNFNRTTRLDMYFLCALSQELSKLPEIKEKVRYYPNTTLYPVGKKYRYVEYQYINSKRIHRVSSVDRSAYLDALLKTARKGITFGELAICLIDLKIEAEEANGFIKELIDSQILVNELSPSVTGNDYFTRIIGILEELNINENLLSSLKKIEDTLKQMDSNQNSQIEPYQRIMQIIKEIKVPYEEKFLFQIDMTGSVSKATLGKEIVDELQSTMVFLNKITSGGGNDTLNQFQQAFYNRYEEKEILLLEALDPEIGIGYPANKGSGDQSPLLENFLPASNQEQGSQPVNFLSGLSKKVLDVHKNEIILSDEDVKNLKTKWDDLPPTIHTMFEIVKSGSDPLIYLTGFVGVSGANLLARFAHTDENIAQFVNEVAAKEQELLPDVLFAEIAHLPDSRVGNVLSRPHIREYEILYLANSDLPESQLIYVSDLYLSIKKGKLCLRSKKLNKEIIPRLTNAHNYMNNSMPVYRFLCDMQQQQGRTGLFFNWGQLNNELSFLPRVR